MPIQCPLTTHHVPGMGGSRGRGSAACTAMNLEWGGGAGQPCTDPVLLEEKFQIGRWVLKVRSLGYFSPVIGNILQIQNF